jgi:CRP-like cAMP-binding protein/tetratricopeptide (TPR) repeat protein
MRDLHGLREEARRFFSAGKHDKAARVYSELHGEEPNNPRWPQKLGETQRRLGNGPEAVGAFAVAATLYAKQGFLLKAIAICKIILALDPSHGATQEMLAELYSRRYGRPPPPPPSEARLVADPNEIDLGADLAPSDEHEASQTLDSIPAIEAVPEAQPLELSAELPEVAPIEIEPMLIETTQHAAVSAAVAEAPEVEPLELELLDIEVEASGFDHDDDVVIELSDDALIPIGSSLDAIELAQVVEALPPEHRHELEGKHPPEQRKEGVFELNLDDIDAAFEAIEAPSEADQLVNSMPSTPLFSSLDRRALKMLIERVEVHHFTAGERIVRQGASGTSLYVLVEGNVCVWSEGPPRQEVARLEEGAFFGEIALLTQRERSATVEAIDECTVLEISRDTVGELIQRHPPVLRVLLRFFRERLIDTLVDTHELFAPFAGPDRESLAKRFTFIEAMPNTVLAVQGEPVDGLYILLAGGGTADREGGATTKLIPGDVFGETSLLTAEHSVATISTDDKCWLLKLSESTFRETIMTHPHVLAVLADVSAQRSAARRAQLAGAELDESRVPLL